MYKEDSTKGLARINPREYKGDSLVQAWLDARKIAMLSRWLDDGGMRTRFLTDVVRFTLDVVVDSLLAEGKIEKIEFCSEAREMLEKKYRVQLNPGNRGEKNLLHNLVLDERRREDMVRSGVQMEDEDESDNIAELTARAVAMDKVLQEEKRKEEEAGYSAGIEELLKSGKLGRSEQKDKSAIVKQTQPAVQEREQETEHAAGPSSSPGSDRIRAKSSAELDADDRAREKRDREYAEKLRNM